MPDKKLTEELLNELLDAPNIDGYIREHDFAAPSLSDYLKQLLQEKGLERSRVVRMADLNETFGYPCHQRHRCFGMQTSRAGQRLLRLSTWELR